MGIEQRTKRKELKRKADFDKLEGKVCIILSEEKSPGYRHRDALKNAAEVA